MLFRRWHQPLEPRNAIRNALTVGHAAAIAAEHHDLLHAGGGRSRDHRFTIGHQLVMLIEPVEAHGDGAEAVAHGALQAVLLRHLPFRVAQ